MLGKESRGQSGQSFSKGSSSIDFQSQLRRLGRETPRGCRAPWLDGKPDKLVSL